MMTPIKKLYEVLVLGLVWLPLATLAFLLVDKMEQIAGEDFTVYGILLVLVAVGFVATEYILEAIRVNTSYAPD
jgi:hypothetical protein